MKPLRVTTSSLARNVWTGLGSIVDICPQARPVSPYAPYTGPKADLENLSSDMKKIGKDFHLAMETIGGQQDQA